MILEDTDLNIEEVVVIQKFNGEPLPENEFERMHIKNGDLIMVEKIENGTVVDTVRKED